MVSVLPMLPQSELTGFLSRDPQPATHLPLPGENSLEFLRATGREVDLQAAASGLSLSARTSWWPERLSHPTIRRAPLGKLSFIGLLRHE